MGNATEYHSREKRRDISLVTVTGATGFIGRALVTELLNHGYRVRAITRRDPSSQETSHPFLEWQQGDCVDPESMDKAVSGADAVCHCAGLISFSRKGFSSMQQVNVEGTKNLLNLSGKNNLKNFVFVSAAATLGFTEDKDLLVNEEHPYEPTPDQAYAFTKKKAEEEVQSAPGNGLDTVILNPCTVYGPGDHSLNSGAVIRDVLSGRLRFAPPGGTTVVAVEDVAEGIRLALERGHSGERYLLANERMEFIDLLSAIAETAGVQPVRRKIPGVLYYPSVAAATLLEIVMSSRVTREMVTSLFHYKYYDATKAREELGWTPRIPFPEAVRRALDYYQENNLLTTK